MKGGFTVKIMTWRRGSLRAESDGAIGIDPHELLFKARVLPRIRPSFQSDCSRRDDNHEQANNNQKKIQQLRLRIRSSDFGVSAKKSAKSRTSTQS